MREFKFRAWDKNNKKMFQDVSTHKDCEATKVCPWIYMQFTGLEDKNGKEIYEGDILAEDKGTEYQQNRVVEWKTDSWEANCDKNTLGCHKGLSIAVILSEVIGNIFENPELLEESK